MSDPDRERARDIRSYVIGYGGALALTLVAFALVHWPYFAGGTTFAIVLGLALVQALVHFRYFLHLSFARNSRDDLQLILFSIVIVALMVSGTLVILANLRHRMM